MTARLGSTVALLALAGALQVSADPEASRASTEPDAARRAGVRIKAQQSDYGRILVTGSGRTVYLFTKEERPKSECYGDCATAWPPVLARGRPVAGPGARQGLLGTTTRRNGKVQVTYAGNPLYLYAPERPSEILCQNVFEFGGLWLIVRPSGKPVR